MLNGKKIVVIMPAYNAEKTLEKTYKEIPFEFVDDVILVNDASQDRTLEVARKMGIHTIVHTENLGYGGNQKTCYRPAPHNPAFDANLRMTYEIVSSRGIQKSTGKMD